MDYTRLRRFAHLVYQVKKSMMINAEQSDYLSRNIASDQNGCAAGLAGAIYPLVANEDQDLRESGLV